MSFRGAILTSAVVLLAGCAAAKQTVYATPDYHSWKRTTEVYSRLSDSGTPGSAENPEDEQHRLQRTTFD